MAPWRGFPELGVQHLGDISEHAVGKRMADGLCRGGGEQNEGVAVSLLVESTGPSLFSDQK
jgi:hypothetical protein